MKFSNPFEELSAEQYDFLEKKKIVADRSFCIVHNNRFLARVVILQPNRFRTGLEPIYCYLSVVHPEKGRINAVCDAPGAGYDKPVAALSEAAEACGVPVTHWGGKNDFCNAIAKWHGIERKELLIVNYLVG